MDSKRKILIYKDIWVSNNKTTDIDGRCVANAVNGILSENI